MPGAAWTRKDDFDIVSFTKDGIQETAYYDNEFNETDMNLYGTSFPDEGNYFIELC